MKTTLPRCIPAALVLTMLAGLVGAGTAAAADDAEAAARRVRLKARTRSWLEARQSLFYRADRRVRVSRKNFMLLHYDLHSPAWRARKGAPETLDATYEAMNAGKGRPRAVTRFAVMGTELVAERFGIGRYKMNGLDAVREVRWVWAVEKGKERGDWYLYGGDVDGRWGEQACDPSPAERRALSKSNAEGLMRLLGALGLEHTVRSVAAAGKADVVVVLDGPGVRSAAERARAVRADGILVARALLGGDKRWAGVRLAFLADWMDRGGGVQSRPHLHACVDRATFDRIVFANLTPAQVFALFRARSLEYAGLTLRTP